MIYLYAISDRVDTPMLPSHGIQGAAVLTRVYRNIMAVISPLDSAEVEPTKDALWRHEVVVEALMADGAVLPVRFGTMLGDESVMKATLVAHYAQFVDDLDRVRGRVELGLRVLWDDVGPPTDGGGAKSEASSGHAYLMGRLVQERQVRAWRERAHALAVEIEKPLVGLTVEATHQLLVTPRMLMTAAYLVDAAEVARFQQRLEALQAVHPALRFMCTGPWPPYTFMRNPVSAVAGRDGTNGT